MSPLLRIFHRFPLALFLAASLPRLFYLFEAQSNPFFDAPVVDARAFLEEARLIAGGQWLGSDEPFWQPPLYIYFLALFCWLFADGLYVAVRLAQVLLGALSCLLVYALGRRALGPAAARVGALLAAFYPMFFYFEGELLAVPLEIFLNLLLLHRLLLALDADRPRDWLLAGLLAGLAALTRPNILLFVLALLLWLLFSRRRQALLFLLPLALVVLPVTLRNYALEQDLVLISANGGVNFYIGNNPDYERTVAIHPGTHWEELVMEPVRLGHRTAAARSNYFLDQAFSYIRTQPLDWVGLLGKKLYLFWSGAEIKRNQDIYYARRHSHLLSLLLWDYLLAFPFGLVAPLSLLGLALTWKRREESIALLRLYLLAYMVSVVLFFAVARYRMPVLPVLLLFAAVALIDMGETLRRGAWRALVRPGAALLALVVLLNLSPASDPEKDAQLFCDLGEVYLRKGQYELAETHSLRALELEPDYNYARHNLAVAYFHQDRHAEALETGLAAAAENPLRPDTQILLGRTLLALDRPREAAGHLRRALEIDENSGMAHYYYGRLLLRGGRPQEAMAHLQAAHRWQPADFWICYELARACQESGQIEQALHFFRRALELEARPEALNALGAVHLLRGEGEAARAYLERALRADPDSPEARTNLAFLDLQEGRPGQAIDRLREVLRAHPDSPAALNLLAEAYARAGDREAAAALRKRMEERIR